MSALEAARVTADSSQYSVHQALMLATLAIAEEARAANYLAMAALYPADTDSHRLYRSKAAAVIGAAK